MLYIGVGTGWLHQTGQFQPNLTQFNTHPHGKTNLNCRNARPIFILYAATNVFKFTYKKLNYYGVAPPPTHTLVWEYG